MLRYLRDAGQQPHDRLQIQAAALRARIEPVEQQARPDHVEAGLPEVYHSSAVGAMPYAEAAPGSIFQLVHGFGKARKLLQREALRRLVRDGKMREHARGLEARQCKQLAHAGHLLFAPHRKARPAHAGLELDVAL